MRNFKTKMGLSVLAIACLGAGVMNLQPSVSANAEDTIATTNYVTMVNGASVCLKDDFSGIRWTTNVDREKLQEQFQGQTLKYGVVVAPNVDATALTVETEGAMDLLAPASFTSGEASKFYTVINYDDIVENYEGDLSEEEVLAKAYALELTARAYVEVEGVYYYADMSGINTARSARQVAIAAELAGEIDEKYRNSEDEKEQAKADKAENYYGMTEQYVPAVKSTGAVGTTVLNLETLATANVNVKIDSEEVNTDNISEVLVGAERVRGKIVYDTANGKFAFRVLQGQNLSAGETYATVFMKDGTIITYPLICATKVLETKEDLAMFNAKGNNGEYTTKVQKNDVDFTPYWNANQEQSGYYILGDNIDANGYVHGSKNTDDSWNNATWNAASAYKGLPIGLTGTFNGMGYSIKNLMIATEKEGLFGLVNGGTVKNTAFINVKSGIYENGSTYGFRYVIANYLIAATIDNVYIETNAYVSSTKEENPGFDIANSALLASMAIENSKISNCYFKIAKTATGKSNVKDVVGGALFSTNHKDMSYTFDNVIVYSKDSGYGLHRLSVNEASETTNDNGVTTYANATVDIPLSAMLAKVATPKSVDKNTGELTGEAKKGLIYLYENQNTEAYKVEAYNDSRITELYDFEYLKGVSRYRTGTEIKNGIAAGYNNLAGFASGCWDVSKGYPAWKNS